MTVAGLGLSAGTVTDGLHRSEPLFRGLLDALVARNRQSAFHQADETRWLVFVVKDDKIGPGWWLWVFGGVDAVVYVPEVADLREIDEDRAPDEDDPAGEHVTTRPVRPGGGRYRATRTLSRRQPAGIRRSI